MSVDTYYYKLSYQLGIQRLHDWMIRFGFGSPTGIDLPGEKSGVMPSLSGKKTPMIKTGYRVRPFRSVLAKVTFWRRRFRLLMPQP
nr:penicillin-binding transpeptidase domain-containing protein [Psychrobacter sp. PraFG1]